MSSKEVQPPWGATVEQSVFDQAWLRRSQEDLRLILEGLREHGSIQIVPDGSPQVAEEEE